MSLDPHNFDPPGLSPLGFVPHDDTRHELYTRPTPTGADTLLGVVWPGDTPEVLVTGLDDSEQYVHARAYTACNVRDLEQLGPKLQRVAFDDEGGLILPVPNAPIGLLLTVGSAGQITATWRYSRLNEAVAVASFNIYIATGGDPIDYTTPTLNVTAGGYPATATQTFAHGTATQWAVRSVSAAGAEESVGIIASATADAQAPAAPAQVTTEAAP